MYLNATVNRELEQKVKCIIGLTNHKTLIHNDLRLVARVVDNMDRRWGLWNYAGQYSNNKIVDDKIGVETSKKSKSKKSSKSSQAENEELQKSEDVLSKSHLTNEESLLNDSLLNELNSDRNELVEEAWELLKTLSNDDKDDKVIDREPAENSNNNKNRKDSDSDNDDEDGDYDDKSRSEEDLKTSDKLDVKIDEDMAKLDDEDEERSKARSKPKTIVLNKSIKLEKDEKSAALLDKLVLYLRIVH